MAESYKTLRYVNRNIAGRLEAITHMGGLQQMLFDGLPKNGLLNRDRLVWLDRDRLRLGLAIYHRESDIEALLSRLTPSL